MEKIDNLKKLRIGVVGYCPPSRFDEIKAREMIKDAYDKICVDFPKHEITVVSGITRGGIHDLAYEEARKRGWMTAGIGCKKAYDFEWLPVDEEPIIVGDDWEDESPTFVKSLDVLIRIGNGRQSLKETNQVKLIGKPVYEYDLPKLEN